MQNPSGNPGAALALYSSVGEVLTRFDIDIDRAELTRRESVTLPGNVQYVWRHPALRVLYVASSDGGSATVGIKGTVHRLTAWTMGPAGELSQHGEARVLPSRPIHLCVDATGRSVLTAYNNPSDVTVHRIAPDGSLGEPIAPAAKLDTGIFSHQVRMTPSNRAAILVTRGNDAKADRPEDPGALKVYRYDDGVLSPLASVAPGGRGGLGYGPRHLDFHPVKPWVYVSIERQNQLHMHRLDGDVPQPEPAFVRDTLAEPANVRPRQHAGAVRVHPAGHVLYVANRADVRVEQDGHRVFVGGENSIAVYAIDAASGEPTRIQFAEPQSFHVRTFALDPQGRILVAASTIPMDVRDGAGVRHVPAAITLFRVNPDGTLAFVRKYDVETPGTKTQFWMGLVPL